MYICYITTFQSFHQHHIITATRIPRHSICHSRHGLLFTAPPLNSAMVLVGVLDAFVGVPIPLLTVLICPNPDMITAPSPALCVPVGVAKVSVLLPTTKSLGPSDTKVPSTVIPVPPGVMVVPPIAIAEGKRVTASVPIVMTGGEPAEASEVGRGMVEVPTIRPAEPRETGVEEMVIAGPLITTV